MAARYRPDLSATRGWYEENWLPDRILQSREQWRGEACACTHPRGRAATGDSTPRDLLIGALVGVGVGLVPFVRSLNAAGCRATKVLVVDDDNLYDGTVGREEVCGSNISFVSVGNWMPVRPRSPGMFLIPVAEFLARHAAEFDRVVVTDVSDVVFQGDPFQSDFDWDAVGFVLEHEHISENPTNVAWVNDLPMWFARRDFEMAQPNSGTISGRGESIRRLMELFLYSVFPLKRGAVHDQAYFIWMEMNSLVEGMGFRLSVGSRNHIGMFVQPEESGSGLFPEVVNPRDGTQPMIYHKYNRRRGDRASVMRYCNITERDLRGM